MKISGISGYFFVVLASKIKRGSREELAYSFKNSNIGWFMIRLMLNDVVGISEISIDNNIRKLKDLGYIVRVRAKEGWILVYCRNQWVKD